MAQDVGQTIKELSEIEFPEGLHGRIMRRLLFLKFRTPFAIVVTLLMLNLSLSGVRVWEQVQATEALTIFSLLWENIEFTSAGVMQFVADFYELAPVGQVLLFGVNCLALMYIVYYFQNRSLHRFVD